MARITFVAHWDWVIHNFRLAFAERLRELGHEVTIVCPHGDHRDALAAAGFPPVHWEVDRRGMRPDREWAAVRDLRRRLAEHPADLVQTFTIKPNLYGPLATPATTPVMGLFSGLGWAFGTTPRARLTRAVLAPVARRSLRQERVHLAVQNPRDRDLLVTHGWADADRVRVMPNGIDLPTFLRPPDAPPVDRGPLRIVTACRLLRDKGVRELVEATGRLAAHGIEVTVEVAGTIDPGNPNSLTRDEVRVLGSTPGVTFVGQVDDVAARLHRANVAVLASSYNEGTPRFLLEAAAAGTALVGSDIPGVRQVIDGPATGILVPPGDVDALADALGELAADPTRRRSLGDAAQRRARESFSEDDVIDAYLDWYRDADVLGATS